MEFSFLYTTVSDRDSARRISRALVDEGLAASTNFFRSQGVYRWDGEVREAGEVVLIAKTRGALVPLAMSRVREMHPYLNPCVVEIPLARARAAFLEWIERSTGSLSSGAGAPLS